MGTEEMMLGRVFRAMPGLAALVLGLSMAMAVAFGAQSYGNVAGRQSAGADVRTADQFAAMKLRQASASGGLEVRGGAAYCYEYLDTGEVFEDILYYRDGWLMELYREQGSEAYGAGLDAGDRVLPCDDVRFEDMGSGLYAYHVTIGGTDRAGIVDTRVRKGGAP